MEYTTDSFNRQFTFYSYLQNINSNFRDYLENNNINVNYYCFYSKKIRNVHHVITNKTTKKENNGYRIITISITEKENNIYEHDNNTYIIFENILVQITPVTNCIANYLSNIRVQVYSGYEDNVIDGTIYYSKLYSKNIQEGTILSAFNVSDFHSLPLLYNLKTIIFGNKYSQVINKDVLPNSLQTLTFGSNYNQVINKDVLPNSLQALTFGINYNQIIDKYVLPNSLQTLTFGNKFKSNYNQKIDTDVLPSSLQILTFGRNFNQIIDEGVLPKLLMTLTFSCNYNQIIKENVFPNSLQSIKINYHYAFIKSGVKFSMPANFYKIVEHTHAKLS
jgi:hypothetical protein